MSAANVQKALAAAFEAIEGTDDAEKPRALGMACMFLAQGADASTLPQDFASHVQSVIMLTSSDVPEIRVSGLLCSTVCLSLLVGTPAERPLCRDLCTRGVAACLPARCPRKSAAQAATATLMHGCAGEG